MLAKTLYKWNGRGEHSVWNKEVQHYHWNGLLKAPGVALGMFEGTENSL
jgi:hypothetical protein